jgi:hypothetical protein
MQDTIDETVTDIPAISAGKLCDRCQIALAYVRVKLTEGFLDFCSHDYNELKNMGLEGYPILDNRNVLSNRIRYIDMWIDTPTGRK